MIGEADHRSVTSAVRPPRLAVLIEEASPHWRTVVTSLIRIFSQTWGGKSFLIVPTDGKRIADKYWELLSAYSPDYLGTYQLTLADLAEADPAHYQAVTDRLRAGWKFTQPFDDWFKQEQYMERRNRFIIEPHLLSELKHRLGPIHVADHVIQNHLIRDHGLGHPFTDVAVINPHARRPISTIVLPKVIEDPDVRLLVFSQTGDLGQKAQESFRENGVTITTVPDDCHTELLADVAARGGVDLTYLRLGKAIAEELEDSQSWYPGDDFLQQMPFQASMLHLGQYYRVDSHREYEEPVTVVVGDTIDDFCLYYCLSRLHQGVHWLPNKWLEEGERRRTNNLRLHRKNRPIREFPTTARVADTIVKVAYDAIDNNSEKHIDVMSFSLDDAGLRQAVRLMDRAVAYAPGQLIKRVHLKQLADSSTACVTRVIEENNYMNQQDMVFINGKSVGRLATPKPKNFSFIDPGKHHWMTSVEVSDYAPPILPNLGQHIIKTHVTRVAVDGVAFMCPGIITSGNDVDAYLTLPHLGLMSPFETLRQYFTDAGMEILPSDKGGFVTDTVRRFGGLASAAKFMADASTRGILELFKAKRSASDGHVVYLQASGGRAFISFDGIKQCVGDEAISVIDELVSKDILRRGMIFHCELCRASAWYDLAGLSTEFVCHRCSLRQQFTKRSWKFPDEPRWYYALAETVFQCYEHNSNLTLLTLDHYRAKAKREFQFLPEMEVVDFLSTGERHEIDVLCLVDGRIVIGECKTRALKPSDTPKYELLARSLKRAPDEIVFATSVDGVGREFKAKVAQIPGARILTGQDLFK